MKREIELRRRAQSLDTLNEAIGAMKSLSAHHFRELRASVEPAREYREGVERIFAGSGASLPAGDSGAGLVVLGGELGLCGAYNARVVALARVKRAEVGPGPTLCVGKRAGALLARGAMTVDRQYGAPAGTSGIAGLLLRLVEDILTTFVRDRVASVDIVSCRFRGVGVVEPGSTRLLPFRTNRSAAAPPARYVSPRTFANVAAREYLYITLYDLLLDALATEHAARLVATQSAEKWLDERGTTLRRQLAATRREASTQEVIEITSRR